MANRFIQTKLFMVNLIELTNTKQPENISFNEFFGLSAVLLESGNLLLSDPRHDCYRENTRNTWPIHQI